MARALRFVVSGLALSSTAAAAAAAAASAHPPTANAYRHRRAAVAFAPGLAPPQSAAKGGRRRFPSSPASLSSSSERSSAPEDVVETSEADAPSPSVLEATATLSNFDALQQSYMAKDGMRGMGGGKSALSYLQTLSPDDRTKMKSAVTCLAEIAAHERAADSSRGRVMLGFCSENAPEALSGLKSWVAALSLPRGMLHGMDVDGVPIAPEELGSVYVKFSTGGAMTFSEMRRSGLGFDALWRPGDALLEPYDGDFRGVYLNVELGDGVFRQFGVLPTDLFMEEEDW